MTFVVHDLGVQCPFNYPQTLEFICRLHLILTAPGELLVEKHITENEEKTFFLNECLKKSYSRPGFLV